MTDHEPDPTVPRRRRWVLGAAATAAAAGLAGCGEQAGGDEAGDDSDEAGSDESGDDGDSDDGDTPTETADPETSMSGATLALDSVGIEAWEVTEDETGSTAPTGEENPTLTLAVGQRYVVENGGWSSHPLAFRAADDTPLLSQSADGEFEADSDVDWVDDDETLAFTVTEDLAAELDYYVCTVHPSMRGDVETA